MERKGWRNKRGGGILNREEKMELGIKEVWKGERGMERYSERSELLK